jgi:inner membrane protein
VVVPYRQYSQSKIWDEKHEQYRLEYHTEEKRLFLLPDRLRIGGELVTEERSRGIYSIPVYDAKLKIEGTFNNQSVIDFAKTVKGDIEWRKPFMAVMVSDVRGIVAQPKLNWQGIDYEFLSDSRIPETASGMHAEVPDLSVDKTMQYNFRFDVNLHGMEQLEFSPAGKSTEVDISSNWPHPSFVGRYLPEDPDVTAQAFTARWQVSSFSSNMDRAVESLSRGSAGEFSQNTFGVSLMNSVDIYQQTERAVKYGLLFLLLTFVAFFLFEVMKGLRLHPMQYMLVAMALTLFYLLLVSLSEHVAFEFAFLGSALACVGLIGVYISEVLRSRSRGFAFSGLLALLYGMLYIILRSEDNALLMGSLLLFGVLTLVMMVTRRLDWYGVSDLMVEKSVIVDEPEAKVAAGMG